MAHATPEPDHPFTRTRGTLAAEISSRIVRLLSDYTGRGPTKARTYVHHDFVVCVLQDTLTKGERVLVAHGRGEAVINQRRVVQRLMTDDITQMVTELTGRRVVAFMSDHHLDPDVAVEAFLLEPPAEGEVEVMPGVT